MNIERINSRFHALTEWNLNHRLLTVLIFAAVFIVSAMGLKRIYFETSWDSYFVEGDPMLEKTDDFKATFGNDYYVSVLVKNENGLFTKENLELIRELSQNLMDSLSYSESITSLTDLEFMIGTDGGMELGQIVPDTIPEDAAGLEAIRQRAYSKPELARRLISKDGTMSWIMVKLRPFPEDSVWKAEGNESPDMLTGREAKQICMQEKYASLNPSPAGMPFMSYEKMQYIQGQMRMMSIIILIVGIVIMTLVTRSLRGVVMPIITTIMAILMAFGWIGWAGLYIDQSATLSVVVLCFAISIAYNIHIYNYFRTQLFQHGDRRKAIVEAVTETGWPVLFSGITTIAAMLSFVAMKLVPMKAIGINSSLCILSVLLMCLITTPLVYSIGRKNVKLKKAFSSTIEGRIDAFFERMGEWVLRHSRSIMIVSGILAVVCVSAVHRIQPAFDVEKTMGRKVPYVDKLLDIGYSELGSLYTYDVLVTLQNQDDAKKPDVLKRLEMLENRCETYHLTKRHYSILPILKDLNRTLNENKQEYYKIPENSDMIAQLLLLYENAGGSETNYWIDYDYRKLRLQVELKNYNSAEVENDINDIQQYAAELFPDAQVSAVGSVPQFTVMQQYLVRGQMWSLLLSVLIVGLLLMIAFGNVKLGLIGMIPNLAPIIFVGGVMGWFGYSLDMMTAIVIPMVLGLAVDDTIHVINHAHLEFDRQKNYRYAILRTFRVIGIAVVMSTVILVSTFLGFTSSTANNFVDLGILASAGLIAALVADLVISPVVMRHFKVFGEENSTNENTID
ncbi:MAG: MMPL family transporter [Paludibacteraceae bacterium]|nr:MMPL family transporter [Paludibacteraceae bacterium]